MQIEEGKVYILSESLELTELARKAFDSNFKSSPHLDLVQTLKTSSAHNMVALFFINGVMRFAAKGETEVKIVRGVTHATLLKSTSNNIVTGSGPLKKSDKIIARLTKLDGQLELILAESSIVKPSFLSKIKTLINTFSLRLPHKSIYIKATLTDEVSPQSKKTTFSIALILLILLFVSIGFGIRQKKINDVKSKYLGILKQAGDEVDQAISLASIDSEHSRQLFVDAEAKIIQIDELKVKDSALSALKQKISESRSAILGEYMLQPSMFLDLSLLSSGFKGDTLAFSSGQVYVMDSTGRRIASVDVSSKKSKVVAGPNVITSAFSLACYEGRVFVLENDGIYEVGSGNQKVIDKTWSGDAFIAAFAGNIYVVDKSGNQIYRYQGLNNSFGEKQNWLAPGVSVSFGNVNQITIDGLIYTLYPNSKVLKFSQGSPLNFNITGVIPEIGNIDAMSASPDNQNIYLLDRAGKRVVVVDKKGVYKAQYVDSAISQATNLVISEADKKIILLSGDKLYSLDIKHL